ncbi:MAG: DEAD/DEAH box helicase family protein [Tenericutes bacterium]|nr:DEAD/DEAH box helicase family protein [Mycoplasmatota bacterium]
MKIQFDSNLDYQIEAIDSIVEIFNGQPISNSNFTIENLLKQTTLTTYDTGVSNKLILDSEDLLNNIKRVQLKNGLQQSKKISIKDLNFTVEMETGTGKTYVYLRTILELNKKYGFTKFIIVVPSIAIREGVYKSLEITKEHFKDLYDNVIYDYFIYDSSKLEQVRSFAVSDNIQIMVINIDAFRKSFTDPKNENKANIIHRAHDKLNGNRPIDLIAETNPIVIIDEPQSVDSTSKSKDAISSLNPMCTLRYSATHKDKYHLMFKLDAVDAYERKLVKQIEVASVGTLDYHNSAYVKLLSVNNKKMPITAKIEIDVLSNGKIKRLKKTVKQGTDLFELSGGREIYSGYIINDIFCGTGNEYIDFTSKEDLIKIGESVGEFDEDTIRRTQIRKTIEEHLDKENRLREHGIKVLSLFFIDKVSNYREYDSDGNPNKGKYARWFEEEYKRLINKPKYNNLVSGVDISTLAEAVHNGYFAADRKGVLKDTRGNSQADEDVYNLIMKDKERLLSFDSKLKFIFSHSALKEGWDNPNVFQICTLNETKSEVKKRQEIGRGMRLAVNQRGERIFGFDVNTLTVMANESYDQFAASLQKEFEEETGIKFGVVEKHTFANIIFTNEKGEYEYLNQKNSEDIFGFLKEENYIDNYGRITDGLRKDLRENKVHIPKEFEHVESKVIVTLRKVAGNLNIKNAEDKRHVKLNKEVFLGPEFKELWDKIKHKTSYSVSFNSQDLIKECAEEIKKYLRVDKAKIKFSKAQLEIAAGGVLVGEEKDGLTMIVEDNIFAIPDMISYLQNETKLTRKTIVDILKDSGRLDDVKNNPQKFLEEVSKMIKNIMRSFIVDGIKYTRIGDDEFYAQELFETEELSGYLNKNMIESKRSVYDYVIYDSEVEKGFASKFEANEHVKVYAKLPSWFVIETPLGNYNPDWAVLIDVEGREKLYFVIETKGSIIPDDLRPKELSKIECGYKHFEALGSNVKFKETDDFVDLMNNI